MTAPIRVLIVDDDALVRSGLTMMLSGAPQIEVVGEASDGRGVLPAVDLHHPDVVLMDIRMPQLDGIAATRLLRTQPRPPAVLVLTTFDADELVLRALQAGAAGFLLKDSTFDEFVDTIRSVAAGQKVLPPRMTQSLFSQIANAANGGEVERTLEEVRMTRRESEVIGLISEGLSNKEIAQRLEIATHTVKSHVRNVMEKLALHTRLQIAAYSRR